MSDANTIWAKARYAFRSDSTENWEKENPMLLAGEHGVVTDSNVPYQREKIGDGITAWNDLGWYHGPAGKDAVTDLKYNPKSENAQSGIAVNQAVQEMASALSVGVSRKIVNKLPAIQEAEENVIYMVLKNNPETGNWYDEYMFIPTLQGEHSGITVTNASWEETETPFILKRATCLRWENDDDTVYNYEFKGWDNSGVETTISFTLPLNTDVNRDFSIYIDFPSLYADFTILSKTEISARVYSLYDFSNPYELIGNTSVDLSDVLYGYATTDYVDEAIGDIESALDELHIYAQSLISGGATE